MLERACIAVQHHLGLRTYMYTCVFRNFARRYVRWRQHVSAMGYFSFVGVRCPPWYPWQLSFTPCSLVCLARATAGKILPEDTKLTKFHGIYQQDNRDVRAELSVGHCG